MLINGQPPRSDDLDDLIAQLQECPTPFEGHLEAKAAMETKKAHGVQQGQAGFSADEPIGTKHVGECVALAIKDPATGIVACAHIDKFSTRKSIDALFEGMSKTGLKVMLLGATYPINPEKVGEQLGNLRSQQGISRHNIAKVLNVLKGRDVDIVAAQVQEGLGNQSSAIYIDPASFTALKAMPEVEDANQLFTFAKMMLNGKTDGIDLETVVDLPNGKSRLPLKLRPEDLQELEALRGKSDAEIGEWLVSLKGFGDDRHIQPPEGKQTFIQNSTDIMKAWLDASGAEIANTAASLGMPEAALKGKPLYVGAGATDANVAAHASQNEKQARRPASEISKKP